MRLFVHECPLLFGHTALMLAACNGQLKVVGLLLASGSDVEAKQQMVKRLSCSLLTIIIQ